jgi:TP901 family phage tail tape measure protein
MATIAELLVVVGAKIDGFEQSMGTVSNRLNAIDREASKAFGGFDKIGQRLTDVGTSLTIGITAPLVAIGGASVKAAGDFESSMNRVSAVGDITGGALAGLRDAALKFGADTQFSAQQAADGMGELAAKGFNAQQILNAMPGVLALAATENMSLADAAKIASSAINQFGLDTTDVNHIADVLARASADSASSVSTLGSSLEYVGPVAKSANLTFEETAAALATLSNNGLDGEKAGTALRGVLGSLVNPSKDAKTSLDALGISTLDVSGNMRPLGDIMEDLRTKGASTTDMFNIFGREASSAAIILRDQGKVQLDAFTQRLVDSEGAAASMAKTINQGFRGAFEQFKGSVETAGIALGTALLPSVNRLLELASGFINDFIIPAATWFGKLPEPVQNAAIAMVALTAAIGPMLLVAGQLISAATTIGGAFTSISGVAAKMAAGEIPALSGALGTVTSAASALAPVLVSVGAALVLGDLLTDLWNNLTALVPAIGDVGTSLVSAFSNLGTYVADLGGIAEAIVNLNPNLSIFSALLKGLADVDPWEKIKAALGPLGALNDALGKLKTYLGSYPEMDKAVEENTKKLQAQGLAAVKVSDHALQLAAAHRGLTKNTNDASAATGSLSSKQKSTATAVSDTTKKVTDQADEIKKLDTRYLDWLNRLTDARQKVDDARVAYGAFEFELRTGQAAEEALAIADSLAAINTAALDVSRITIPTLDQIPPKLQAATADGDAFKQALAKLGIDGKNDLNAIATEAAKARDAVLGSDLATDFEKKSAVYVALKAQVEAAEANGEKIPKAQRDMLDKLGAELNGPDGTAKLKGPFETFGNQVSTIITNLSQDLAKSLFSGETSWAEKGIGALKSLGQAVTASFIEPATAAIGKFVAGALADLIGGKGFGGVVDAVKGLGSAIGGIFGGGGSAAGGAAGAAGQVAGGAGSAAGGIGGAVGGAASGVLGTLGAVGSIGSAISGVIGNFQMAGMNENLQLIENNTRRWEINGANLLQQALLYWPKMSDINDFLWGAMYTTMRETQDKLDAFYTYTVDSIGGTLGEVRDEIRALPDRLIPGLADAIKPSMNIQINVSSPNPSAAGQNVLQALRAQGAFLG